MEIRYSSSIAYDAYCSEQVPIDLFCPLSKRPHPFNAQFPLPQPRSQGFSLGNLEQAGKGRSKLPREKPGNEVTPKA